ncbi:hypothetical protein L596_025394 [Steinernema carpocapsae]|uniref:Uncharacterized protein n=1 Tax=Steinernema carpocapsae TaxID=34508 RepID=A0A4U5M7U1_STECR|nr:hypothetical protein L596_025394 [Steinernema carpocapsae]
MSPKLQKYANPLCQTSTQIDCQLNPLVFVSRPLIFRSPSGEGSLCLRASCSRTISKVLPLLSSQQSLP